MHENESSARRLTAKANMRRVSLEAIIVIPIKNLFNFSENYNNIPNFDIMTYTILYGTDIVNKYI